MIENLAWKVVFRAVVLVRCLDFASKLSSFVWKSSNVERETRQVLQTGESAFGAIFDNNFSKSSDVQEGEFLFDEINIVDSRSVYFSTDH